MLMIFLTMFFSTLSTGMMSYLAMSTQLGPWVAPVFVVVLMVLAMPFFDARWFSRHVIVAIAGGSVGGMIGICLGLSLPSFYFMHKHLFNYWIKNPVIFSIIIASFIIAAAAYAFLLTYILRDYFFVQTNPEFPMSKLIHDVVYVDKDKQSRRMMLAGLLTSAAWNIFGIIGHWSFSLYSASIHMAPLLTSVGFMTGLDTALPVLVGLITRVIVLRAVHIYIPSNLTDHAFLITFCSGMLFSWFFIYTISFWTKKSVHYWKDRSFLLKMSTKPWFVLWYLGTATIVFMLFSYWGMSILVMFSMFLILMWLARYMVDIVAKVGIIEIDTYVWFILLIAIYFIPATSVSIVALSLFAMICLGLVVDFMFSYKLADLSGIDYKLIVKHQLIAVLCCAATAGLWFLYLNHTFDLGSFQLLSDKAHELDSVIRFGKYDYRIFVAGFVYAIILKRFFNNVLTITGGVLMAPFVSTMLIVSGAFAHLIKNREKFYPVCFGIYAGHMLWIILSAFKQ